MGNRQNEHQKNPTHTTIIYLYSRLSHKGFKVVSKRHAVQKDTNEHLRGLVQREKTTDNIRIAGHRVLYSCNSIAACFLVTKQGPED